jgi:hypothetical protein
MAFPQGAKNAPQNVSRNIWYFVFIWVKTMIEQFRKNQTHLTNFIFTIMMKQPENISFPIVDFANFDEHGIVLHNDCPFNEDSLSWKVLFVNHFAMP